MRTWAVTVGVGSTTAVPDGARNNLLFHNPGMVDVYICQAPRIPSIGAAGTLLVMAGADRLISSPGTGAWNAGAVSAAVLTVLEF